MFPMINLDILSVSDIANSTVKFDEKGDGLARYTIYNYQKDGLGKTDYKVIKIKHHEALYTNSYEGCSKIFLHAI